MEYLFAWAMFGVAAASLAKGKNRNVVLWVTLGLLIGPFALLAIALMKPAPGPDQGYD
ncbi:MAG TPA: hypothetical protein VJ974_01900 [Geopsychrobacteraceae bacterium]|nr:hypothetical protein [Geopsychrobacteraceae bacterium]